MQEIDQLRFEVDQIHKNLVRLFRQRLLLTQKIWQLKKKQSLPLIDLSRESAIIHGFDEAIDSPEEKAAVQGFLKSVLLESRQYLELEGKNS